MNSATFKPPWTGVKRKLTFYDLKCEFYRYCAPSNGNYRHKQLKRRGETRKSRPRSPFPAVAALIADQATSLVISLTALRSHSINYFNGSKIFVSVERYLENSFSLKQKCCTVVDLSFLETVFWTLKQANIYWDKHASNDTQYSSLQCLKFTIYLRDRDSVLWGSPRRLISLKCQFSPNFSPVKLYSIPLFRSFNKRPISPNPSEYFPGTLF